MTEKKHVIIPVFIPHKGCPFDCIYCNQKTISGQMEEMTEVKIRSIIEGHLLSIQQGSTIEIGFYGGSFTGLERELQIKYLQIANEYISSNKVSSIRLSTRPDYIDRVILETLQAFHVQTIELGVQSMDEDVLRLSTRGHNASQVISSSKLIKEYGIQLGIQTMIGLPGDNRFKDVETARKIVDLAPSILRIYPTLVIKGTELEKSFYEGKFNPLILEEAVDISAELLAIYEENKINVIRIGLQPTDTINTGMDVVAGPFHPAFRQLVEAKLMLLKIEEQIQIQKLMNENNIVIYTGSQNISNVAGHKKENLHYLIKKYGYKKIKIVEDKKCDRSIRIEVLK